MRPQDLSGLLMPSDDEAFPAEAVAALDAYGLPLYYVPEEHGGKLRDFTDAAGLIRAVAGRDLTVAIAHGKTFLGAVCVWVAGEPAQARRVADRIAEGVPVSWGLTERDHGSDLVAGELTAVADGEFVRLDGEKFMINNATRGGLVTVLARTAAAGGPRGFGLFLIERDRLCGGTYTPLPKVRTIGIRGADISGFVLDGVLVDPADEVGAPGTGLETVVRALQLTRTLCSALSLGAADHGLAEAAAFTDWRSLYGRRLADLPAAARTLTDAYADHLLNEAFATVATRLIQTVPGEMSVVSAAVKYLVPVTTEGLLARLRRLMGARAWLRDVRLGEIAPDIGVFQKIERDHRIVSLFDGNTVVNLNSLVSQFPTLARGHRAPRDPAPGLAVATDLAEPLPPMDYRALRLVPTRGISLLHNLDAAVAAVTEPALAVSAAALRDRVSGLLAEIAAQPIVPPDVPPYAFALARRLAYALAGSAALALFLGSRHAYADDPRWRDGAWPLAALDRVHTAFGPGGPALESEVDDAHAVLRTALPSSLFAGVTA